MKPTTTFKCLLFLAAIFTIGCESEPVDNNDAQSKNKEELNLRKADKIDICHYDEDNDEWMVINISERSWPDHELHGDQWLDRDGDGYTAYNECGIGSMDDCDDTDASINPGNLNCIQVGDYRPDLGGYVFYLAGPNEDLNGDGIPDRGLVVGDEELEYSPTIGTIWSCEVDFTTVPNVDYTNYPLPSDLNLPLGAGIGDGAANSVNIYNEYSTTCPFGTPYFAAALCEEYLGGGFNDWFLPSIGELRLILTNLIDQNIGTFSPIYGYYFSSTETNIHSIWILSPNAAVDKILPIGAKISGGGNVRPVRAF